VKRWAWLPVWILVFAVLLAVLPLTGCSPTNPVYTVEVANHSATFTVGRVGEPGVFAILLGYLDGPWVSLGQGSEAADFGTSLSTPGLNAGTYQYVIFWLPKSEYDLETMGTEALVDKGHELSGHFVIQN
jgi:hypothetical protein